MKLKDRDCRKGTRIELKEDCKRFGDYYHKGKIGTITKVDIDSRIYDGFHAVWVAFDDGDYGYFKAENLRRFR